MADNTDVTIIYSIPHLIFNSVLYSPPDKAETVDDEIENDNTENDELLNSCLIADKDDSFYHSSISKVTVHIVWYNKLCFRTNFEDAEKAYNMFPMSGN